MFFLISFAVSLIFSKLILVTKSVHGAWSTDDQLSGVRRFHEVPVPRVGGIAILSGIAIAGAIHGLEADSQLHLIKWAGVAVLPVFLGGLIEDISKQFSPRDRLLLAFLSAGIAYYELNCGFIRTEWEWFDREVLSFPGVSLVLTLLMVGGVSHATNIIDGFNGLLLGVSILALVAFWIVAGQTDLKNYLVYISIMAGALGGVFVFNFPRGRIFCGDGGAYMIGFMLAILSLLMVRSREEISPWFPLLVLAYPVTETLFSMYRKTVWRNRSASEPDGVHLHMLIYGRVVRRLKIPRGWRNPATSVILWAFAGAPMIPAVVWWNKSGLLILSLMVWLVGYVVLYLRLVRFAKSGNE